MKRITFAPTTPRIVLPPELHAQLLAFLPEGESVVAWAIQALQAQAQLLIPAEARALLAVCAAESARQIKPYPQHSYRVWGYRPQGEAVWGTHGCDWERMGWDGTQWQAWQPHVPNAFVHSPPHGVYCAATYTAGFAFLDPDERREYAGGSNWYSFASKEIPLAQEGRQG